MARSYSSRAASNCLSSKYTSPRPKWARTDFGSRRTASEKSRTAASQSCIRSNTRPRLHRKRTFFESWSIRLLNKASNSCHRPPSTSSRKVGSTIPCSLASDNSSVIASAPLKSSRTIARKGEPEKGDRRAFAEIMAAAQPFVVDAAREAPMPARDVLPLAESTRRPRREVMVARPARHTGKAARRAGGRPCRALCPSSRR